jgi:hypothetical protein
VCRLLWLRTLDVADEAVQVAERLAEPSTKVVELADPLSTVGEQLVDPL